MEKKISWVRIITLDNGEDVLLTKEWDEDENEMEDGGYFKVLMACDIDGTRCSAGLCFKQEDIRDKCFNELSKKQAQTFYDSVSGIVQ